MPNLRILGPIAVSVVSQRVLLWVSHLRPHLYPTYVDLSVFPHFNMSIASTVSTSMLRDLTLGDEPEIMNCIRILAATKGNGTPFCPNSFQEKDMVKLCIGLGQAHQEGVLQLSNTEMVLVFWSGSEMMAAMHLFTVAMVWHDEPITIYIHSPTGTQVWKYMAVRGRHPSGTQAQSPVGDVVCQSSPSQPDPEVGAPSCNSTWPLGTLMTPN